MQKYSSNIADSHGNAFAFALVTVTDSTGALAQLYSANDITKPLANPLTTDALSNFSFYAANGRYSWSASGTGFSAGGISDIELFDPADPSSAAQIGTTPAGNLASTNVQAALNELDTEKASLAQLAATDGATLLGNGTETVADSLNALQLADYTALRAYAGPRKSVTVIGSGIAGDFVRDDADTTTADNGGTVIVASNGKRWKRVYNDSIDMRWFGAVSGLSVGVDNTTAINNAILAAYNQGGGEVAVPGQFGVAGSITLKAGVYLKGFSGSDYYAGTQFAADSSDGAFGSRIFAMATMPANTDLVIMDIDATGSTRRRRGRGARNIILDGNKKARYVLSVTGNGTDFRTSFDNVHFQGATSHGIYVANAIALVFTTCVMSANGGYGVYGDYGVSDSSFTNCYVHTNQSGGYFFGDGSLYTNIRDGKCEDNYGNGISISQSASTSTIIKIDGAIFQTNNGPNFVANGTNAQLFIADARSNNSAATGSGGATDTHCYTSGGVILISGGFFDTSSDYEFSAVNNGVITVSGDAAYSSGAVGVYSASAGGSVRFANGIPSLSGKLPMKNRGARKALASIAASSSGTVTFTGVFENGLGATYYDSAIYELIVAHAPYASDSNSRVVAKYVVSIAGSGGSVSSTGVTLISAAPNSNYISGVSANVSGRDIAITINTGAQPGTSGQSTIFNVCLIDVGQNMYGLDG